MKRLWIAAVIITLTTAGFVASKAHAMGKHEHSDHPTSKKESSSEHPSGEHPTSKKKNDSEHPSGEHPR